MAFHTLSGAGAPTGITPSAIGQHYTNTSTDEIYIAAHTVDDTGWIGPLGTGGGGAADVALKTQNRTTLSASVADVTLDTNEKQHVQISAGHTPGVNIILPDSTLASSLECYWYDIFIRNSNSQSETVSFTVTGFGSVLLQDGTSSFAIPASKVAVLRMTFITSASGWYGDFIVFA